MIAPVATAADGAAGPFASPSPLPFHAPRFDLIKDSDVLDAAYDDGALGVTAMVRP